MVQRPRHPPMKPGTRPGSRCPRYAVPQRGAPAVTRLVCSRSQRPARISACTRSTRSLSRASDPQMSRSAGTVRGYRGQAVTTSPPDRDPSRCPFVAVAALERLAPPVRSPHVHRLIRTRERFSRKTLPGALPRPGTGLSLTGSSSGTRSKSGHQAYWRGPGRRTAGLPCEAPIGAVLGFAARPARRTIRARRLSRPGRTIMSGRREEPRKSGHGCGGTSSWTDPARRGSGAGRDSGAAQPGCRKSAARLCTRPHYGAQAGAVEARLTGQNGRRPRPKTSK